MTCEVVKSNIPYPLCSLPLLVFFIPYFLRVSCHPSGHSPRLLKHRLSSRGRSGFPRLKMTVTPMISVDLLQFGDSFIFFLWSMVAVEVERERDNEKKMSQEHRNTFIKHHKSHAQLCLVCFRFHGSNWLKACYLPTTYVSEWSES